MATRENQGLQIALISLVFLVIVLCVFTYMFYSGAETAKNKADNLQNQLTQTQNDLANAQYKWQTMKYMVDGGIALKEGDKKTLDEIQTLLEEDLTTIPGSSGSDADIDQLRKAYFNNMAMFGENFTGIRNYESLPDHLLSVIRAKNKQVADLLTRERELLAEKEQLKQAEADRSTQFETAMTQAETDREALRASFQQDRNQITAEKDRIAGELATKDGEINRLQTEKKEQEDRYVKQIDDLAKRLEGQKAQIQQLSEERFEVPDATITSVNQKLRVCYIDVGRADGLQRQQTFAVYDEGATAVMRAEPKGRIEVVQLLDDHLSLCRILEDDTRKIIVPGDVVHTPAWGPGRRVQFAIAGSIDIDDDGKSDRDLLESLIRINGGQVDEEVTSQTRYLVEGELLGDIPGEEPSVQVRAEYQGKIEKATQIGVDRISVDKLLSYMGWRGDVGRITFGRGGVSSSSQKKPDDAAADDGGDTNGAFRPRTPPRGDDGAF